MIEFWEYGYWTSNFFGNLFLSCQINAEVPSDPKRTTGPTTFLKHLRITLLQKKTPQKS